MYMCDIDWVHVFSIPAEQHDQVVPQCDKRQQRCLPHTPTENCEVLDLFHGDQIFALREE